MAYTGPMKAFGHICLWPKIVHVISGICFPRKLYLAKNRPFYVRDASPGKCISDECKANSRSPCLFSPDKPSGLDRARKAIRVQRVTSTRPTEPKREARLRAFLSPTETSETCSPQRRRLPPYRKKKKKKRKKTRRTQAHDKRANTSHKSP